MIAPVAVALAVLVVGARFRPRPARLLDTPPAASARSVPVSPARRRRRGLRRRRPVPVDPAEVAEWCGRLAAGCRSGATLRAALGECAPPPSATSALDPLVLALQRGMPLADAVAAGPAPPHLDLALTVIRACAASGGPAAEPLDRAAAALRARAAESADRATHSAQARLSALVMTVLPAAMLALLLATSGPVRALVVSPVGAVTVVTGAGLNLVGWRWMRRTIERAAR